MLLPPSLAVLITEQLNQPAPTPLANTLETTTWMFPSPHPGTHRQAKGLYERLAALGITVRSGRRAVLMALAQDLPAGVLASLIGIHASTATAWSHELKRDWTAYLATRINPPNTANHDK
ncbi:hypothetical protein Pen01_40230 [Phytomonospora endophytica]|nr:hypothetical protein Pen01_40230 [Phytomonospora endophytica]